MSLSSKRRSFLAVHWITTNGVLSTFGLGFFLFHCVDAVLCRNVGFTLASIHMLDMVLSLMIVVVVEFINRV